MSLNCNEIERVIRTFPAGGIIRKIYQPDRFSIIINIFDGKKDYFILGSVQDKYNRICLSPEPGVKKEKQMRFEQLLNANISGGRIRNIYQHGYSRIVLIEVEINKTIKKMVFRMWGNAGNILLMDEDDIIIETLKRMPKRQEWPGERFVLPEESIDVDKYNIREEFNGDSINENIYNYFDDLIENESFAKKKHIIESMLNKEISDIEKNLERIDENVSVDREETYRKYGELLKVYSHKIKKGIKKISLEDYDTGGMIEIPLQEALSPIENVNRYFTKYKKIKNGKIKWAEERYRHEAKLRTLREFYADFSGIKDIFDLIKLEDRLRKYLKIRDKTKGNKKDKISFRQFIIDKNFRVIVSRSAKEADKILSFVNGNDYWFHIRDYAGSHVIVRRINGTELTEKAKNQAAMLAVYFSKGRNDSDADVYFSLVKYLRKQKGGPDGLVFPTQEKNINIRFDRKIFDEILSKEV